MALFGKGGVSLTPAQQQFQELTNQQMQQALNVWQPIQAQFAQRVQSDRVPLQQQALSQGQGKGRAIEASAVQSALTAPGDQITSGRGIMGLADATNTGAAATSAGLIQGGQAADADYLGGLQQVIAHGLNTQGSAMRGLEAASNTQQREQQANLQAKGAFWGGLGQLAGLGLQAAAL